MRQLDITYHHKRKCISLDYDDHHQWVIYDVDENSEALELFYKLQYAINHNFKIKVSEE